MLHLLIQSIGNNKENDRASFIRIIGLVVNYIEAIKIDVLRQKPSEVCCTRKVGYA